MLAKEDLKLKVLVCENLSPLECSFQIVQWYEKQEINKDEGEIIFINNKPFFDLFSNHAKNLEKYNGKPRVFFMENGSDLLNSHSFGPRSIKEKVLAGE